VKVGTVSHILCKGVNKFLSYFPHFLTDWVNSVEQIFTLCRSKPENRCSKSHTVLRERK